MGRERVDSMKEELGTDDTRSNSLRWEARSRQRARDADASDANNARGIIGDQDDAYLLFGIQFPTQTNEVKALKSMDAVARGESDNP